MKNWLVTLLIIIVFCFAWGFFIEPHMLKTKIYQLKNNQLKGLKIAFISDIHASPKQHEHLKEIVKQVNSHKPDIILLGGDFVKGHGIESSMPIKQIADELGNFQAKYGVWGVLGNHDWWYGGEKIAQILKQNGINILMNENVLINNPIKPFYLAGIEDLTTRSPDLFKALNNTQKPVILLSHNPDIFPKVPSQVFLTLAGHTHGGQINIPFYGPIFTSSKFGKEYAYGKIEENGHTLIVTKGIGTSILPMRFFCAPEIVIIEFI